VNIQIITLMKGVNESAAIVPFRAGADVVELLYVSMLNTYTDEDIGKTFHIHGAVQTRTGDICGGGDLTLTPSKAGSSSPARIWLSAHFPYPGMYEVVVTLRDVSIPDGEILWRGRLGFKVVGDLPAR
jgi:hypothetical protein